MTNKPTYQKTCEYCQKELWQKYNVMLLGEKCSWIDPATLLHCLTTAFNIDITQDELNEILPAICSQLGMKHDIYVNLEDIGKPKQRIYTSVTLF